jgi:hypothetical protein
MKRFWRAGQDVNPAVYSRVREILACLEAIAFLAAGD